MSETKLITLSTELSINIINIAKKIKGNHILINQLLRSGTSIGANIREANYSHSKADFIAKLQIALKECYETEYWLELFEKTNIIENEKTQLLLNKSGTLRRILIASLNTAKNNINSIQKKEEQK